jgi:alkaline phosphatase D
MKKTTIIVLLLVSFLNIIPGHSSKAQSDKGQILIGIGKGARYNIVGSVQDKLNTSDLQGNLVLLNLSEEQPEYIHRIYTTAFKVFSVNPRISFYDLSKNNKFIHLCEENGITHTGGPMLGNISSDGVNIWIRTLNPAKVEIRIKNQEMEQTFGPVFSDEKSDLTAVVEIKGLQPETTYEYEAIIDGKTLQKHQGYSFTTTPGADDPAKTRIVFGSCPHKWGLSNEQLAEQVISRKPSAMLMNGDLGSHNRDNNIAMHRADYLLRDFWTAWKKLSSTIPVYATWDDHDYFNNDRYNIPEGYTLEDKEAVWKVFRDSWNNPSYGLGDKGKGLFFHTRIGPADVIMLDNRYFREKGAFLGKEQMQWLENRLLECKGPFIILSNGTAWNDFVSDGKDSWGAFDPEGREKIFKLIEKNHIGGVLLISGDRHGARGFKIPRSSGFNFYEFNVASLGSRVGPPPIKADWDTQLFGISGEYAFGEFSFDTTLSDPEVTFRLIHGDGTTLYELTLTRSQLTP